MKNTEIRFANEEDVALILDFIKDLAEYEKMSDFVVADEALLREWIFEKKKAEVIFALEDGKEVGFALFFHNFSTFLGRAGIYLEDLFVIPEYRGKGYGASNVTAMTEYYLSLGYNVAYTCRNDNKASIALAARCGYKQIAETYYFICYKEE